MEQVAPRPEHMRLLFIRLSLVIFCAELAHGMLLYAIIPELAQHWFPKEGFRLFNLIPVREELAGFCLAIYTLAELIGKVPAGHVVDHHGPDRPLAAGLILSLVTVPLMLLSREPHLMLLGAFLHGIGAAPVWPAVISSWTRGRSTRERGEIMGQILTWWMAGLGGGLVSGKLLIALSGRAEQAVTYAPLVLWMVAIGGALWSGQALGQANVSSEKGSDDRNALRFPPELKVMGIGLFLQNLAFGCLILPFNFLTEQKLEFTPAQVGLLFVVGGGPAVLLLGPMGKLSDRVGRRRAVVSAVLVTAPLLLAAPMLAWVPVNPWIRFLIMVPGVIVAGVAYAFLLPAWHALALGRIPAEQRGRSLALLMSVEMAALAGGHMLGTPLYTKVSFVAPFLLAGIVFACLGVVYRLGYVLPQEPRDEPTPAP